MGTSGSGTRRRSDIRTGATRHAPRRLDARSLAAGRSQPAGTAPSTLAAWEPRIRRALPLTLILVAAAVLRLWLIARDVPAPNSDEATVGLMALHILHGDWTVFYWGQQYMGSLEAMLSAPFVALLGPTALALHAVPLLCCLGFLGTVYLLGARLYSRGAGLVSAALLAVGPPFFVVLSVRALGGYIETLLLGNLLLLLALREPRSARSATGEAALFGGLAGLALWTNLLIVPYLLVCALLFWLRRRGLRNRAGLALGGGLVLGASPAIVANVLSGGATIATILGLTVLGSQGGRAPAPSLLGNLAALLTVSLPIVAGAFVGGTQVTGLTLVDFAASIRVHPAAYATSIALTIVASVLFVTSAVPLLRNWRRLRSPAREVRPQWRADALRTQQGSAALLLLVVLYTAAFALGKQQDAYTAPRYLFPLYSATPLFVAGAMGFLARLRPTRTGRFRSHTALAGIATAALLVWYLAGSAALTSEASAARDHGVWIGGNDDALLRLLRAHHVHTVISNDYWEGLRLTYASGETIITVMMTPEGHPGFNRYRPYVARGLADPRPAYVELTGTPEAALDAVRLRSGALPGYATQTVGLFTVLVPG